MDIKIRCGKNSSKVHFFKRDHDEDIVNISILGNDFRLLYKNETETPVKEINAQKTLTGKQKRR